MPRVGTERKGMPRGGTKRKGMPRAETERKGMPRAETERKGMPRAEEKLNDDKLELTIEEEQLRDHFVYTDEDATLSMRKAVFIEELTLRYKNSIRGH